MHQTPPRFCQTSEVRSRAFDCCIRPGAGSCERWWRRLSRMQACTRCACICYKHPLQAPRHVRTLMPCHAAANPQRMRSACTARSAWQLCPVAKQGKAPPALAPAIKARSNSLNQTQECLLAGYPVPDACHSRSTLYQRKGGSTPLLVWSFDLGASLAFPSCLSSKSSAILLFSFSSPPITCLFPFCNPFAHTRYNINTI